MKTALQEGLLVSAELFQWNTRNSKIGQKVVKRFAGSSSPTYRQALWLPPSQRLQTHVGPNIGRSAEGIEDSGIRASNWEEVIVIGVDRRRLEEMTGEHEHDDRQEALGYRLDRGTQIHVGILPDQELMYGSIDEHMLGVATRIGEAAVTFYPGSYNSRNKTFHAVGDIHTKVIEPRLPITQLPDAYPGVITV